MSFRMYEYPVKINEIYFVHLSLNRIFVREIEYQRNNGKKEYNNGKGCEHQNDDCGRC